jgi:DNA-binding protein H-NS
VKQARSRKFGWDLRPDYPALLCAASRINIESTSKSKSRGMEINQPSLKELLAQRQTLQQQLTAARQREAEAALADIVRKMHEYQISIADLMGRHESPKVRTAPASTYRD